MNESIKKFLEFNGKSILFLHIDGQYWVAVKPICEALDINYKYQHEFVTKDEILGQLSRNFGMVGADNRLREMTCLPEKYIYGWLFSLNSSSPSLQEYKLKCYDVLYDHFHGSITKRQNQLLDKVSTHNEILVLEKKLRENSEFLKLEDLKAKEMRIGKSLKQLDFELLNDQLTIF